ncbi:bro1-like domain protein, partial [Cystoisospora suis]
MRIIPLKLPLKTADFLGCLEQQCCENYGRRQLDAVRQILCAWNDLRIEIGRASPRTGSHSLLSLHSSYLGLCYLLERHFPSSSCSSNSLKNTETSSSRPSSSSSCLGFSKSAWSDSLACPAHVSTSRGSGGGGGGARRATTLCNVEKAKKREEEEEERSRRREREGERSASGRGVSFLGEENTSSSSSSSSSSLSGGVETVATVNKSHSIYKNRLLIALRNSTTANANLQALGGKERGGGRKRRTEGEDVSFWSFEMACTVFNIGACLCNLGIYTDRQTIEGCRDAVSYFTRAAAVFTLLRDEVIPCLLGTSSSSSSSSNRLQQRNGEGTIASGEEEEEALSQRKAKGREGGFGLCSELTRSALTAYIHMMYAQ